MGADENAAIIRRAYEAFNSGDMETLTEPFDEGAVWHTAGRSSLAGDYQGCDATFAFFGRLGQETGGTFRVELQHLLADDERVVGSRLPAQGRPCERGLGALSRPLRLGRVLVVAPLSPPLGR
jgi:ketosteroid isomerase-like protein